jgi:hypothetical protein
MEEQFYTLTKHASTFRIKCAVDKNAKVTARECEVWWNGVRWHVHTRGPKAPFSVIHNVKWTGRVLRLGPASGPGYALGSFSWP